MEVDLPAVGGLQESVSLEGKQPDDTAVGLAFQGFHVAPLPPRVVLHLPPRSVEREPHRGQQLLMQRARND